MHMLLPPLIAHAERSQAGKFQLLAAKMAASSEVWLCADRMPLTAPQE